MAYNCDCDNEDVGDHDNDSDLDASEKSDLDTSGKSDLDTSGRSESSAFYDVPFRSDPNEKDQMRYKKTHDDSDDTCITTKCTIL